MASGASRVCCCNLPVSSSTRFDVTPRMRAMFSARSIWRLIQKMRSATLESMVRFLRRRLGGTGGRFPLFSSLDDPGVFRAAALRGVHHQRAVLESDARKTAGHE